MAVLGTTRIGFLLIVRQARHREDESRVSAILKEGASKVRDGTHYKRLSREASHSSCTLLSLWLKPWRGLKGVLAFQRLKTKL